MLETQIFSAKTITDANTLLQWIQSYICQPHPQLGRKGAICPFVPPALDNDTVGMVFHYEIDGRSLEDVETTTRKYIQTFLDRHPQDRPNAILQTLLVIFPNISVEDSTVIDKAHQKLKSEFVQNGLMLGQFHMACPESAVRNPDFPVMVSPLPFFSIRYMAQHDILFLHQRTDWFAEYDARMGSAYERGKVPNPVFVHLYKDARQQLEEQQTNYDLGQQRV